ncbi:tRNA 2-thiouridine(34) synthase MnmA [Estrella lausannensis]|uniref:tRNA-specific 2-thiouridylase MnmA n=1 Tax=Estrella lausannensis TaxID=483423 RepID=A0A0H5DR60_9BACT|nr:tRNA 2-thiouridine(34) synthase MnmA [Estrella lausannensis]CRX39161.1 tRNA-specific 2-thiouridylase MnmA [Estrella lausannensis]
MSSPTKGRVVVGLSGGVDSSVSAYLLKKEGYEVIGLYMKNWVEEDESGVCRSAEDFEDVVRISDQIGIPYHVANFAKNYQDSVFESFLEDLKNGLTPNPDILCNREIKFKVLLAKAEELGAGFLATGHYARLIDEEGFRYLAKGLDPGKDQSYFLSAVDYRAFAKVLFPVGHLPKAEVRKIAEEAGLATARKKDSTGICFIGKRKFKPFVSKYLAYSKGTMISPEGKIMGEHQGIAYYTIGQRHGLGIGGEGEAWFVVGKNPENNQLIVAQGSEHPALFADTLTAEGANWITPEGCPTLPFACHAKIRYRQNDQECIIEKMEEGKLTVRFKRPQRAITPRQSIVFYQGDKCLGGAFIEKAGPSYFEMRKPVRAL